MAKLISRPFEPGDEHGIVKLYNLITNRNRTVQAHQWEWLEPPAASSAIWVIIDTNTNDIVGHHGLIPLEINYYGETYLLGKTENTIIHPDYRGSAVYILFEKRFLETAKQQFDLLLTTSGHGTPGKIRQRLGYKPVSKYTLYFAFWNPLSIWHSTNKFCRHNNSLRKIAPVISGLATLCALMSFPFFYRARSTGKTCEVHEVTDLAEIKDGIDVFWEENKSALPITLVRNSQYLHWRILKNPNLRYQLLVAQKGNIVLGYLVLKLKDSRYPYAVIEDVVVTSSDDEKTAHKIVFSLLDKAKQSMVESDLSLIIFPTLPSKNIIADAIRRYGFGRVSSFASRVANRLGIQNFVSTANLLVKPLNTELDEEILLDVNNWYFTGLFLEGIQ